MNKIDIKNLYSRLKIFIKKHKIVVTFSILIFLFVIYNVISSLSRVGFNMNVVYNQNKPEDAWYLKLSNLPKPDEINYNVWNGEKQTSIKGLGTKENPYLIESVGDLYHINDLLNQQFYLKKGSKNVNNCLRPTLNYSESTKEISQNNYTYTLSLNNTSSATIVKLISSFKTSDEITINSITIDEVEINYENNDNKIIINSLVNIASNTISEIVINYTTTEEKISIDTYTGYDSNGNDYYSDTICEYAYYDSSDDYIKVVNNLDFANKNFDGIGSEVNPFKGNFDGNYKSFKDLLIEDNENKQYNGLFNNIENATIKNINLTSSKLKIVSNNKNYSSLIVGYASGNSKIYNIGIKQGNIEILRNSNNEMYIGSIAGYITGTTIVTNSYSYADIKSSGNNNSNMTVGGLVGYRTGENTKLDDENPKVYLLVMYGKLNITSSLSTQYVYNGHMFNASEAPTYCYYLWLGDTLDTSKKTANTYAILKSYDDIVADGFKAHLNNYRFMVDYYLNNRTSPREDESNGYNDIAIWYTLNNTSIYPILKKYESNNSNYNVENIKTNKFNNSLKVNLVDPSNNNQKKTYYIKITDKNENINDYTNHKITLPFNSKTAQFKYAGTGKNGNYTMTLSGWKLISVVKDNKTLTTPIDGSKINYNYVLRSGNEAAQKDINTIYAEGGYYLVPDGVTEITFEAYYAYTIFAKDAEYDQVYNLNYSDASSSFYGLTWSSNNYDGLTPSTAVASLQTAYNKVALIDSSKRQSIYDVVIMLCGNLHYNPSRTVDNGAYVTSSSWARNTSPVTIMSQDNDGDLEPDYALYTRNVHDETLPSIRLNFVNFLGIPQVGTINAKLNAFTLTSNSSLEVTETSKTDRIDLRHYQAKYIKLNSGYFNLYNLWEASSTSLTKNYIYFGGFAQAIYFNSGVESRALPQSSSNDVPTFVISGGRIDTLSSTYFNAVINVSNDVYFFIDGGYINNFYTTYNASINKSANVTINDSYINTYYAGGHTESSKVAGGVNTTINNSKLVSLYGGPEYGSITNGSILNIDSSDIDNFYGSGYGGTQTTEINLVFQDAGTSLCSSPDYYYNITNSCSKANSTTMSDKEKTYCFGRMNKSYGLETKFYATTYSKAGCASKAFAVYYSSLSAANVDKVTVNIKNSTINNDFYGGGNKGIVDNSIVVNMDNTTVKGDLYGGGRSNETETVEVYEDTTGYEPPKFISYTVDTEATYPKSYNYTWSNDKTKFNNNYVNTTEKLIYSENEGNLGNVKGTINLNIKNSNIKGNIYGGGNLSEVIGNISINLSELNKIDGQVYGGGNKADVSGNINLKLINQNIKEVYGGGNLGNVNGKDTITLLESTAIDTLYGGGNKADVTTSEIYLTNGKVKEVYGGSNQSGTVKNSNIYAGKVNDVKTEEPEKPSVEEPTEEVDENDPYLPNRDTCKKRDITYNYKYTGDYFNFSIDNNTSQDFTEWTATITFDNSKTTSNGWSGHANSWNGNTLTITHYGQWYAPTTTTLTKNSTTTIFNNDFPFSISSGTDVLVSSVIITAKDSDGNEYSNEICHDEPIVEPDPDPVDPPIDDEIDISIETIYGGNNIGGLCENTNIIIDKATVRNVYGGGNEATSNNTNVELNEESIILENVFGGGNEAIVNENTQVLLKNTNIKGSAYAGGNGLKATVIGDTKIISSGKTIIEKSLFGGGNKAETGGNSNSSTATVIITGGTIKNNVYGGANTSKIYGYTKLIIGKDEKYENGNILINGTVFGGGEANESGSENYDYSYISVTKGIDLTIDEKDTSITINGSIFGSGNASSTSGYSNININNFGLIDKPKNIISIQRSSSLSINNSSLNIVGTTDRTNEYNSIIYSLSRIDDLSLYNNSYLYLQNGTNVVKKLNSYYKDDTTITKQTVSFENGKIVKNVDNRIYMAINKSFNIINSENLATGTFGEVNGMMFFGLYELDRDNLPSTGIYNHKYETGATATKNELFQFISGSYVMGQHKEAHDYKVDGFYTNYTDENGKIETKYIEPTPEDAKYYQWIVGESATTFEIALTASKFATMGTTSLPLLGFEKENTYFELISYNDNNLKNNISLINPEDVPRVAKTNEDALSTFGLKMSNSNANWLTDGTTHFISNETTSKISGTTKYVTNNTKEIPILDFIFVHSKNITEDKKLGSVLVGMYAYQPIDEVTYNIQKIYINITLDTKYYETDNYESSMTPGKEYELFVNSNTDITSKSSLSAYFSLFVKGDKSIYKDEFHRVLISNYKLPENTRITMIDRTVSDKPEYYYYDVSDTEPSTEMVPNAQGINTKFYIYPLKNFIKVGSISKDNNYNDTEANKKYYNEELKVSEEEFIFIVDYSEANIQENIEKAELLLELKDEDEYTHYDSLGVSHSNMVYNIYTESESEIDIDLTSDKDTAYHGYDFNLKVNMDYNEKIKNGVTIKDTNYIQDKMGLKLSIYNSKNERINGATLIGTIFNINGKNYYADLDGSVRANISDYVSDVLVKINVNLEKSLLPTDEYRFQIEAFGSPDGLYYGLTSAGKESISINIVNENYGISSSTDSKNVIISSKTGKNKKDSNEIQYNIDYISQFKNANIRVKLYRRKYDQTYSLDYELVDLKDYIEDDLTKLSDNTYLVTDKPVEDNPFIVHLKNDLKTGTYKMTFELYDKDSYIDSVYSYMIIK